jgi:predicted RNA-binding Zn-ribbon protein involved in translation (DUF1610 family)
MFRCPHCGQAQEIVLNERMSVINVNEKKDGHGLEGTYLAVQGSLPDTWTEVNREAKDEFKLMIVQFYPTGDIPCVNPDCGELEHIDNWLKTWEDPLYSGHLESENLCHCGGELWMDKIEGTNQYAFICEDCGWVNPNTKVSGG